MKQTLDAKRLTALIGARRFHALRDELAGKNEVDIAQFLGGLAPEQAVLAFRTLPKDDASDVFSELDSEMQQAIIASVTDAELADIVEDLAMDDAVDMLEEMPANIVKRVLKSARPGTRALINQFLKYPGGCAGSIMTAEFTDLRAGMTVAEAIRRIRRTGEDRETIYTCYVIDEGRRLEGVVTLKDLLLAPDSMPVRELMDSGVISIGTLENQKAAASLFQKYGLLALPVVDHESRLVGIITVDDAMEVMEQQATEDLEVMNALHPSEKPYLKTGVFSLAKNRIAWLLVLMVSGMVTGSILGRYEAAFAAMPLLVTFIPMLTDTGGNAGSQSSTLVIRGIAVGDITGRDIPAVLWKELRVAVLVGAVLSAVNYVRLLLTYPGCGLVALTVALTMFCTVVMAKTIGGVLPLVAKFFHADPAIMAAPLITTIVDALSLIIYFSIAVHLLPL